MPLSKIDSDSLNSPITAVNLAYTGTLTGGTGVVNFGSGQFYKDASGNVGIGTSSPSGKLDVANRGITKGSLPAGSVLQVVSFTSNTNFSTASNTPADTQLVATITPSSSTSKILVLVHHADAGKAENAINGSVRLTRNGTTVFTPTGTIGRSDTTATNFSGGFDFHFLDSPATASAVTYKTQAWTAENSPRFYLGLLSTQHSITLMEIAA